MEPALIRTDSHIIAATVFSDVAHVTRRATARLGNGVLRLTFDGLPSGLDPASLRVSTSRGQVRAIETDVLDKKADPGSSSAALKEAVELLEAKAYRLAGEIEALYAEIALIDRVVPNRAHEQASPLWPDVFLSGLDVLAKRRAGAIAALRTAEREAAATERELADARQRLVRTGTSAGAEEKQSVLVVSLDAEEGGESMIDLTYEAAWATWRPYYHVRLDERADTVECARFADLWQETKEDWDKVRLRLSTAQPEAGLRLPRVLPWSLGVAKSFEDKLSALYQRRPRPRPLAETPPPGAPPPEPVPPMSRARLAAAPADGAEGAFDEVTPLEDVTLPPAPPRAAPAAPAAIGTPRGAGGGAGADFEAYQRQFEAEGIFRETTTAGLSGARAMRAPQAPSLKRDDGVATDEVAALSWQEIAAEAAFGAPRSSRLPPSDHPDSAQLADSALPRDASGGINFELEVKSPTTANSGRERHRLSLGSVVYPAKVEYLLRPAITSHAFGRVTVINSEAVPLLEGPAAIFVGDAFFGETRIRTTPAGGKLILDLGAETAIKCARRSKTTVRSEGILTKADVHLVEVGIDVENHLAETAEIELQDQVPISRDPAVKVRLARTVPKDASLDELTGILTFRLRIAAGGRVEVSIVYEIEAPPDYQFMQSLKEVRP